MAGLPSVLRGCLPRCPTARPCPCALACLAPSRLLWLPSRFAWSWPPGRLPRLRHPSFAVLDPRPSCPRRRLRHPRLPSSCPWPSLPRLSSFLSTAPAGGCRASPEGIGALGSVRLCSAPIGLLATLLLLTPALLLAFLTLLLLATAASETPYQTLCLVSYSSDGLLSSLDGLPGLVGYLTRGILRSSALLRPSGLGLRGARLLCSLLGLCRGWDLQVKEATVFSQLQTNEGARLVHDGAGGLPLLVGGPLGPLRTRQIGYVAHYLLIYRVALLVDRFLDYVALLVDGALDGLALLVGGRFAEQLSTGSDVLGYLADLIKSPSCGVLDLIGGLASGVLNPLHSLPGLVGDAPEGTTALILLVLSLLALLVLVAFAHFSSPFGKATIVVVLG